MTEAPVVNNRVGQTALAFDVGSKRIGVARAHMSVRFAGPLTTLTTPVSFVDDIIGLCDSEDAGLLIFGLPRGLNGQDTAQTAKVRAFVDAVRDRLVTNGRPIPIYWMDEALTSVRAESELAGRPVYAKADVDALAATYILEDFLKEHSDV